jgi:hypothetical protein
MGIAIGINPGIKNLSCITAIAVDGISAVSWSPTAGARAYVLQNLGTENIWVGGSDVAPSSNKGFYLTPGQIISNDNIDSTFKLYFKCAAGKTSIIGGAEA